MATPRLFRVIAPVTDIETAASFYAQLLALPGETRPWGERSFYGRDPFGNPICLVDSGTTFTG